jgi:hypothetical protein
MEQSQGGQAMSDTPSQVELVEQLYDENKALKDRIKRLEEVGDEMKVWCNDKKSCEQWDKIKEDKYE